MKRLNWFPGITILVLMTVQSTTHAQEIWVGKDGNIRNPDARAILIDKGALFVATKNEIYKSRDISEKWYPVFSLPPGENEIITLGGSARCLFAGTRRGLFRSRDYGSTWKNVFRTFTPDKNNVLCIEASRRDPKNVMIGTEKGVFFSDDSGSRWTDISANLRNRRVRCLAFNKTAIFAGADDGLYVRRDEAHGWERVIVKSSPEGNTEEAPQEALGDEGDEYGSINCVTVKDSRIYVGFDRRILYSDDDAKTWKAFKCEGLIGAVNKILPSRNSDNLYAATTKGVFEFRKDRPRWDELYKGMAKVVSVKNLVYDSENEGHLWAVTEGGIFRLEGGRYMQDEYVDVERNLKTLKIMFTNEPTFKELQQAALEFAELSPDKTKDWHRESRMSALLPKVSFGLDDNRSSNYEIYTSATRDYVVTGPDDIAKGWDVSVSWELGKIIWSDDQTNIDVRSRLTTQLRNDILDDLRRAYYERRRIQFELAQEPPKDIKARFEKEMRLQELTQAVDDLTGNYLSEHVKK